MNDNLLYFPYIDIPKNNWTIKSLLYWDKVGIIVPPSYKIDPDQFKKETRELVQTDLVQQIFPYEYTSNVDNFDKGFIKLLEHSKFNLKKKQYDFYKGKTCRIHVQKFGEDIMNKLVKIQVAEKSPHWSGYFVENKTARLIMIYLATVIGKVGNFTPASDKLKNLDLSLNQNGAVLRRNAIRQNLLDDLIPYPLNPDLTKLRHFKDKHHEELRSFRILLEQTTLSISTHSKKKIREELQSLKIQEINDKRSKILSDLNQSRIGQITFGTMFGLAGAAIGFCEGNSQLGAFSLGNAIYSAFQGYDNSDTLSKDYSYLALIDKNYNQ